MTSCPYCKATITELDVDCPHCGERLPPLKCPRIMPQPKAKPASLVPLLVTTIVVITVVAVVCLVVSLLRQ